MSESSVTPVVSVNIICSSRDSLDVFLCIFSVTDVIFTCEAACSFIVRRKIMFMRGRP